MFVDSYLQLEEYSENDIVSLTNTVIMLFIAINLEIPA